MPRELQQLTGAKIQSQALNVLIGWIPVHRETLERHSQAA